MLDTIYQWFETRIAVFRSVAPAQPPSTLLAYYKHFLQPVWPAFAVLLAVSALGSIIEVALQSFVGNLVDQMRVATTPATFLSDHKGELIWMAFVAMIARPLVSTAHDLVKNQMISIPLQVRIRWDTHRYVVRQSMSFFQNDFAGRIANKITQNAPALRDSVLNVVDSLWYAGVQFLGAMALFGAADWRLTVPLVIWFGAYMLSLRHFVPRIQKAGTEAAESRSVLVGRLVDSYTNISTVKLFSHSDREDAYVREALQLNFDKSAASQRNLTSMELTIFALNGLLMVTTIGLALVLWSRDSVSLGSIAVVAGLVMRLVAMSGWIFWVVAGIFENIGTVHEGMETISRPNTVLDAPAAPELKPDRGEIRFEHIRFDYGRVRGLPGADPTRVINDLSLTIKAGERVGLVGRSGAGKSTLVNLLLRFYDLEGGRILIDGQDIAKVTQDSLRSAIGMVTQDTSLLHRSVRDNILYGRLDASEADVIAAARRAEAHEFILGLEDLKGRRGYDAHVGERGVKLSGGQRQRIAIARVLLKNAPILVLDEATSALDSESERLIQNALTRLMRNRTVVVIAHRLSTIEHADQIAVLDDGRIVERGTHAMLIARGGKYAALHRMQFREDTPAVVRAAT